ncbi:hypothetical protein [Corynebacterium sp. CCM 9204]|uniref:hypothetical protein n=1 Tax=Corynebacterium sp. CCM 9204 TaxID=3057616 RepID=UPI0035231795
MRKSAGYDSSTLTPRGMFATLTTLTVAGLIATSVYMYIGDEEAGAATSGKPRGETSTTSTTAPESTSETSGENSASSTTSSPEKTSSTSASSTTSSESESASSTTSKSGTSSSATEPTSSNQRSPESTSESASKTPTSSTSKSSSTRSSDRNSSRTSGTSTRSETPEPTATPEPSALGDKAYAAEINPGERRTADVDGTTVYYPSNPAGDIFTDDGEALTPDDENWLTAAPAVEWQRLKENPASDTAWDFPFSASDGPWQVTDGIAHGFSQTPQGAALAIWHIYQGVNRGGVDAARTARTFIPPSTDPARLDAVIADPSLIPNTPDHSAAIPIAYKVESFDGETASIAFATARDGDVVSVVTMTVRWIDGDWHQDDQFIRNLGLSHIDKIEDWARW